MKQFLFIAAIMGASAFADTVPPTAHYKGTCLAYQQGGGKVEANANFDVQSGHDQDILTKDGVVYTVGETQTELPDKSQTQQVNMRISFKGETLAQVLSDFDPAKPTNVVLLGPQKIHGIPVLQMTCSVWP